VRRANSAAKSRLARWASISASGILCSSSFIRFARWRIFMNPVVSSDRRIAQNDRDGPSERDK